MGVCYSRRDDDELRQDLRRAEGDPGGSGLQVLTEAGQAGIDLPDAIAVQMRHPRSGSVAADHVGLTTFGKGRLEKRIGVPVRRTFGDRNYQKTDRGNPPPGKHPRHCRMSFVS